MLHTIKHLLADEGIRLAAPVRLADCTVQKPYLLERVGIADGTAVLFAVPYYTTQCDDCARNISAYAVSADYHGYFASLFDRLLPQLRKTFPQHRFAGFTDHSPIAEAEAAVRAGLGFFGCNHLFLTNEYSSYVFLGEIITDALLPTEKNTVVGCTACNACQKACPVSLDISRCLSALTQKKGPLTKDEEAAILAHGLAWGCDRCQERCPVTLAAKESGTLYSNIPFFKETALPHLSFEAVANLSDEAFAARAYSWRGKETVLRNLKLLEGKENAT